MSAIIQKWLMERLGFVCEITPENIAVLARDGRLYAELLYNYNVIYYDQFLLITQKDNPDDALENMQLVAKWLKLLDIHCTHENLFDISRAKGAAALKTFYQLYLKLRDKDTVYFVTETLRNQKLQPPHRKFEVSKVRESIDSQKSGDDQQDHPLSEPLRARRDVIEWHKNRYAALVEKCKSKREEYLKYLHQQFDIVYPEKVAEIKPDQSSKSEDEILKELNKKYEIPKNSTYEELIEQQQKALEKDEYNADSSKGKQIIKKIKQKHKNDTEEKSKRVQAEKVLLMELWEKQLANQEKDFNNAISKKMIKQSNYEKQMATKMFQVRHQKELMMANKAAVEEGLQKAREAQFVDSVFFREKSKCDQKSNYYFERDRTLELHRRLYAEKKKLKEEMNRHMCRDIVDNIVNLSLKHAEFKEQYEMEVPKRLEKEWGKLFISDKSIFDVLPHTEDIVQECLEDFPPEYEEIYSLEIERQNALDDKDFEDYCEYNWPWNPNDHDLYDEGIMCSMELGLNVLGHIVHRALSIKYPEPPLPPKPELPKVSVAVCINGLTDNTTLAVLQKLLDKRKIKVIEMQDSINFCLDAFKAESTIDYVDQMLEEESERALDEMKDRAKRKTATRSAGGLPRKGAKKKGKETPLLPDDEEVSYIEVVAIRHKECQTPKLFPCEEVPLSHKAKLGQEAFKILGLGNPIDDQLLVEMFIEYLKELKDIEGWVLINFPTTIEQAAILEERLTSKKVPNVAVGPTKPSIEELLCLEQRVTVNDDFSDLRQSRLLPISTVPPPVEENDYDTYLTAFVNLKLDVTDEEIISASRIIDDLQGEDVSALNKFYTEQGCNYTLYYKVFDFVTVKHLAKLIIGDYSIPPKSSLELFGDSVYYLERSLAPKEIQSGQESRSVKSGEKVKKPKSKKTIVSKSDGTTTEDSSKKEQKLDKKKSKSKSSAATSAVTIIHEDKETQIPEVDEDIIEILVEPGSPPKAGEEGWPYVDIAIPEAVANILATLWENAEDVYITDLKQLFFIRRITMNVVIPYTTYVERHMMEFISRPDDKQSHMFKFQTMYNEIDADMRDDAEVKAELHCRIVEFREKLWLLCDERMKESEEERKRIINENWMATQLYQLINNSIVEFQTEIDRFVDTAQIITDYYTTLVTKVPSKEPPLQKKHLNKLEIGSYTDVTAEAKVFLKSIAQLMTEPGSPVTGTPFHKSLEDNYLSSKTFVKHISSVCDGFLQKTAVCLAPTVEGKSSRPAQKVAYWEPDPEVKEAAAGILEEWKCALEGEVLRVNLRLDLLRAVSQWDLRDMLGCGQRTFYGIYDSIKERYQQEVKSIETACEVLERAVEAESPIQPQLVLEGDKFFIQPSVILFCDPPIIPKTKDLDEAAGGLFAIGQLDAITDTLMNVAPYGCLPERSLLYLVQDMITLNAEDGRKPLMPEMWRQLTPHMVVKVFEKIFGPAELVDWKDFIIYNLNVSFPSEEELLRTRERFRNLDPDATELVKDYQFYEVEFWFDKQFWEEDEHEAHRLKAIKRLLFKLFSVNEDTVNYTALLLAFCKDVKCVLGLVKGLTLSIGNLICSRNSEGEAFLDDLRRKRVQDELDRLKADEDHEENLLEVSKMVQELVEHSMHLCDSVLIEDLDYSENKSIKSDLIEIKPPATSLQSTGEDVSGTSIDLFGTSVGFEAMEGTQVIHFLPFEPLLSVMSAIMPWHVHTQFPDGTMRERLENVYNKYRNEEFHNAVVSHELLNSAELAMIVEDVYKFKEVNPLDIVKKILSGNKS